MNKKLLITILTILGLTVAAGGFWYFFKLQKTNTDLTQNNNTKNISNNQNQKQEKTSKQKNTNQNQTIDGELKPEERIDTSNWKTYYNKEYGFCVKYPKELKVEKDSIHNSEEFDFVNNSEFIIFSVIYYEKWSDLGWKPKENNNQNKLKSYIIASNVKNIKQLQLDGKNAYSAIFKNPTLNYQEVFIMTEYNGHIYKITFSNTDKLKNLQKEILQSVKIF